MSLRTLISLAAYLALAAPFASGFASSKYSRVAFAKPLYSSFAADGSEYSSNDNNDIDDDEDSNTNFGGGYREDDDSPTIELGPVPMSKNSGNRFVAFVWDRELSSNDDALDRHYERIQLTEDHVMYCRKANLYNETFNTESMVDVLWSLPMYVCSMDEFLSTE